MSPEVLDDCQHAFLDMDEEPWPALRRNFSYVSDRLRFDTPFLGRLYEQRLLTRYDMDYLRGDRIGYSEKANLLLIDILPTKPPDMFPQFCEILREVGQLHIADRLMGNTRETAETLQGESASPFSLRPHPL